MHRCQRAALPPYQLAASVCLVAEVGAAAPDQLGIRFPYRIPDRDLGNFRAPFSPVLPLFPGSLRAGDSWGQEGFPAGCCRAHCFLARAAQTHNFCFCFSTSSTVGDCVSRGEAVSSVVVLAVGRPHAGPALRREAGVG